MLVPEPAADPARDSLAERPFVRQRFFLVRPERQVKPDLGHVERVEQCPGDEFRKDVTRACSRVFRDRAPQAAETAQSGRHHGQQQRPRMLPKKGLYRIGRDT